MPLFNITEEQLADFDRDGYVIVEDLFDAEEMQLLRDIAKADREVAARVTDRQDAAGGITSLALSNEVHDDIFGAIVRSRRMMHTVEKLLGDEVYHYHHKMMLKEPFVGGAWEWHQDYGYWYNNGCLFPDMASVMIAVDRANKENGCLQVIRGSHKLGRIDHGKTGGQTGADMERVDAALQRLELVHCEIEPGTAIFFHSNLLHRSDQNTSPNPRWALVCCYNTRHNDPYKESKHPGYSRLEPWDDEKIKEIGKDQLTKLMANSG